MKDKLILALVLIAMCGCLASCGKEKDNPSTDVVNVIEDPGSSVHKDPGTSENRIIDGKVTEERGADANLNDEAKEGAGAQNEGDVVNEIVDYGLYSYTTNRVKLRSKPSTDSEVVKVLERKTNLRVAEIDSNNWAKVKTESGEEGFVFAEYIMDPVSEKEWNVRKEQSMSQKVICIDAGHQAHANNEKEPIGPGASETKAKVSSGTKGVSTGKMEYELTLEIALKLQAELEQRGYSVIMCRTTNDVNISNAERAAVANKAGADAFIRIHADGAENAAAQGTHTICQTSANRFNGQLHDQSLRLSQDVLSEYVSATGAKMVKGDDGVDERDDLSGINWCSVPVTLIELGFMTNPTEDSLMSSADYQQKMVTGIANGVDKFFAD